MYSKEWKDRRVDQRWVPNNLSPLLVIVWLLHSLSEDGTKYKVTRYSEYSEKQTIQYNDEGNLSTQGIIILIIILITSQRTGIMTYVYLTVGLVQKWWTTAIRTGNSDGDIPVTPQLPRTNHLNPAVSQQTVRVVS